MTQDLIESIDGGVATLTMNRPEARNASRRDDGRAVRSGAAAGGGPGGARRGGHRSRQRLLRRRRRQGHGQARRRRANRRQLREQAHDLRAGHGGARWLHEMPKPTLAVIPARQPAPGCRWRWPATCASPQTTRKLHHRVLEGRAVSATSAAATFSPSWSAPPRRASCTSPADVISGAEAQRSASSTARCRRAARAEPWRSRGRLAALPRWPTAT